MSISSFSDKIFKEKNKTYLQVVLYGRGKKKTCEKQNGIELKKSNGIELKNKSYSIFFLQ